MSANNYLIWLKACPRCGGDLFREFWPGITEMVCLQCGYSPDPERERELAALVTRQTDGSGSSGVTWTIEQLLGRFSESIEGRRLDAFPSTAKEVVRGAT